MNTEGVLKPMDFTINVQIGQYTSLRGLKIYIFYTIFLQTQTFTCSIVLYKAKYNYYNYKLTLTQIINLSEIILLLIIGR